MENIAIKLVIYIAGVPRITWTNKEVNKMNIIEDLQLAIIEKFSYGWMKLDDLRNQIQNNATLGGIER